MRNHNPAARENSDLTAREFRIEKLTEHLAAQLRLPPQRVAEICTCLDEAVEFSALEGTSAASAIADFIRDGNPWAPVAGWSQLAMAEALPVIPRQASRLLRASDDAAPAELEKIAATDPVLTGRLLAAANSALHGSRVSIVSPLQAILRMGVPEARRVLLAACLSGLFASKTLRDVWDHSETIAQRAADLAPERGIDPDTAWVAGILHDIGRLIFARLPARLTICEQHWLSAGFPVVYAESLAYGTDHAAVGAECLRAWELPENIVEAVEFHHRPECSRSRLAALLTLAEDSIEGPSEDLWPDMRRIVAGETLGMPVAYRAAIRMTA